MIVDCFKQSGIIRKSAEEQLWEYLDKTIPKDNLQLHHELKQLILAYGDERASNPKEKQEANGHDNDGNPIKYGLGS